MPTLTPNAALARNFTTLTLTAQDVTGAGVLSDNAGGAKSLLTTLETIERDTTTETENITPVTSRRKNMVILETGTTYNVAGFFMSNDAVGTPTNFPDSLFDGFDYFKLIFTRFGVTETYYGIVSNYKSSNAGKGKFSYTFTLEMVDIGSANPLRA